MNQQPDGDDRVDFSEAEPRDWHYAFVHRSLRDVVFEQTEKLMKGLDDPGQIDLVPAAILRRVAQDIDQPEEYLADHAAGIRAIRLRRGLLPVYVFVMPRPLAPGEAYLVAIVNAFTARPRMLYFTLERCAGGGTALCRWDEDGNHLNLGVGPVPEVEAFLAAIAVQLDQMGIHGAEAGAAATDSPHPGADAPLTVATTAEWIDRESLSVDVLGSLLDQALFDSSLDDAGRFAIRDLGIDYFLVVPKSRRDYVTLCAWWTLRPDGEPRQQLAAANRINLEYLFIRAAIEDGKYLCLSQNVPVLTGIRAKYLVTVLRNFANACREAIGEHGAELIGR